MMTQTLRFHLSICNTQNYKAISPCQLKCVSFLQNDAGFFKGLIEEFAIDNVSISISIMPLPFVPSETVSNLATGTMQWTVFEASSLLMFVHC